MLDWIKNAKIGIRIVLGFSAMLLVMVTIGVTGLKSVDTIEELVNEIYSVGLVGIDALIEADRDLQQLLVAERSMLFAEPGTDMFKGFENDYETNLKQVDERFEKYAALASTQEERALIPKFRKARKQWEAESRRAWQLQSGQASGINYSAVNISLGTASEKFEQMRDYIDQLTNICLAGAEKANNEGKATHHRTIGILATIMLLGLGLGVFLMWAITRGVTKPLKIAIDSLSRASEELASASGQVSSASQNLASGSSQQAASVQETSSSLEEMASMTKQNADHAIQAKNHMEEAKLIVDKVNRHILELTTATDEIAKSSQETEKIIKTIDEIAFQTNLLALNAAVEAARAGEAGAGFAVVADEVRNLAMRAAEAAKNTSGLIENTIRNVKEGNQLTKTTQEAFQENIEVAGKVAGLVEEIAAANSDQAQGIDQINNAVADMDKVVQENSASAEESASAAEEMTAQAEQLKEAVGLLQRLVNGAGHAAAENTYRPAYGKKTKQGYPQRAASRKQSLMPAKRVVSGEVTPEQVIPFDEDDLAGF